jgi:hypothetical protein
MKQTGGPLTGNSVSGISDHFVHCHFCSHEVVRKSVHVHCQRILHTARGYAWQNGRKLTAANFNRWMMSDEK